ncbi:MAG: pyridoxal phosphate-dependent aminotransferase [Acidimicrobiia bacterium]|nr:pyridoxal phosphate-dependent aminotransferase [Acidimicrobiia bacterium]
MPRSGIREVNDLSSRYPDVIHLEIGQPNFATPEHISRAAGEAAVDGFTYYTPNAGIRKLRRAAAEKLRRFNGISADPENVVITTGGVGALSTSLLTLCDPGDAILLSDPTWPNYAMMAVLQGLEVRRYNLRPEDGWLPNPDEIEKLITPNCRALVLVSPSNPTATVIGEDLMRELLEVARRHDLWVISDEVYDAITFGKPAFSAYRIDPERVISVFSFSKTYAMTGWRVGYAVARRDVAEQLSKCQEPTTSCVNSLSQIGALTALRGPQDDVWMMRDAYWERRDQVMGLLSDADIAYAHPEGAFYMWVDISQSRLPDTEFVRRMVTDYRVAVVPGTVFGPNGTSHVRISLATDTELLLEGISRLVKAVRSGG